MGIRAVIFDTGTAFLAVADGLEPGCVLLDVRMPGADGFEVLTGIAARGAALPTVVMTGHGDVLTAVRAMKLGAADFLEKPFTEDMVVAVLDRLFANLDADVAQDISRHAAAEKIARLTEREAEVLHGLIAGHSNKVLAYDLGISVRTIEMHRASLMDRLDVRTFAEALRIAFEAGVVGAVPRHAMSA